MVEAGIEPFSMSLKIKKNSQFEIFATSMHTLNMRAASVLRTPGALLSIESIGETKDDPSKRSTPVLQ